MRLLCWLFGHRVFRPPVYITINNCDIQVSGPAPFAIEFKSENAVCLRCRHEVLS